VSGRPRAGGARALHSGGQRLSGRTEVRPSSKFMSRGKLAARGDQPMKGKSIGLSPQRRFVCDLLEAAASVPSVPVQRQMGLSALVRARAAHPARPPWAVLFTKAYALMAAEMPAMRRAYMQLPWGHLYEHPCSIASIAVEREYQGEPGV